MHVGIDGRAFATTRAARGVAHYTAAMLSALADAFPDDRYTVLVPDSGQAPATLAASPAVRAHTTRVPGRLLYGAGALTGRPRLDRLLGGVDVVWSPAPAPLAVSGDLPLVLTLHDLSFARRPHDFTRYERMWHALARPATRARGAARVVAVSAATRELALDRWELDPDRVVVVHPGVTHPAAQPAAATVAAARERYRLR
ncbi:MAG TPA: glycosyltransferase, partial [Solirubrobacteraceae bacterium]